MITVLDLLEVLHAVQSYLRHTADTALGVAGAALKMSVDAVIVKAEGSRGGGSE